jgi:hypothetical protein
MRWIVEAAEGTKGKPMNEALLNEIKAALKGEGVRSHQKKKQRTAWPKPTKLSRTSLGKIQKVINKKAALAAFGNHTAYFAYFFVSLKTRSIEDIIVFIDSLLFTM